MSSDEIDDLRRDVVATQVLLLEIARALDVDAAAIAALQRHRSSPAGSAVPMSARSAIKRLLKLAGAPPE